MSLGEKIKLLRKEKGWSQEQLGKQIDIVKSVIWKYEKDAAIPSAEVVKRMAQAFSVSTDYMLFDEAEKENITKISDKKLLKQFEEINTMDENIKEHVRFFLDVTIHTYRIQHMS